MRFFVDLNEKREAIRRAQEQPRSWRERLRDAVVQAVYRIRPTLHRPGSTTHTGASVQDAISDAARADLDVLDLPGYFEGERMSRAWMQNGNAAGSVVPGSYEAEVFGRR